MGRDTKWKHQIRMMVRSPFNDMNAIGAEELKQLKSWHENKEKECYNLHEIDRQIMPN